MGFTAREEGPAILQLQKWGPSGLQLNLSQYHKAFISPTRELLLLLSYQHEALLLPLFKGAAICNKEHGKAYDGVIQDPDPLSSGSPMQATSSRSDLVDDIKITSDSLRDDKISLEAEVSRSNYYSICDVNMLAWGICADNYPEDDGTSFRELLFVSRNHGVVVHAFRRSRETSESAKSGFDVQSGEGLWVEWGPSTALPHSMDVLGPSSTHCSVSRDVSDEETAETSVLESKDDELSVSASPKRWLRSFLTKVETLRSEGSMCTRFPQVSHVPSSAMVVSFNIFESNSELLRFLSEDGSEVREKGSSGDSDDLPSDVNISYKCSRMFSNGSHDLIGFALTIEDLLPVNTTGEYERDRKRIVLVVAKVVSWGLQWVCSVKLDMGPKFEWTDYKFFDKYLLCLTAGGVIFFYGAITGEYIAFMDITKTFGLHPKLQLPIWEKELLVKGATPSRITSVYSEEDATLSYQSRAFVGKTLFRRLLVASHTLLLAVIDEYGIVYVLRSDHIPNMNSSIGKLHPHFHQLKNGTLACWEVGGADISHQRRISDISLNISDSKAATNKLLNVQDNIENMEHGSVLTGFSAGSSMAEHKIQNSELPSHARSIFLPTEKYCGDDDVCFSTFGITRFITKRSALNKRNSHVVHSSWHVDSAVNDDRCSNWQGQEVAVGEAVGCTFNGSFYLVTQDGLSVVLPAISVSSDYLPIEALGYWQTSSSTVDQAGILIDTKRLKQPWPPWQIEVLDRVLIYEGCEEADHLCSENGWDLKICRMRQLQLALGYLKFEEIEISLEMLAEVNMAEEGVLRLLFAAIHVMFHKGGSDNDVSAASRLLALGTHFAIRMIRKYGVWQHIKNRFISQSMKGTKDNLLQHFPDNDEKDTKNSRRLEDMAHLLEIIRSIQCGLVTKFRRPHLQVMDGSRPLNSVDSDILQDNSEFSNLSANGLSLETSNQQEFSVSVPDIRSIAAEKNALQSMDSFDSKANIELENYGGALFPASETSIPGRKAYLYENPKDMIGRWEADNLDQKNIVKDALLAGRLPLAVLQLHLHHLGGRTSEKEPHDAFDEVRDIGRAIAYDLFLKDETGFGVAILQRLGEDVESCLRQLLFGTVRRSLRFQVTQEMKKYGYLGPYELKILDDISLVERVYPCSSFWRTFCGQKRGILQDESINSPEDIKLPLMNSLSNSLTIECGEIDGVVLGLWTNISKHSDIPVADDDSTHACYWASAALWSDAWDRRTIDRVEQGIFSYWTLEMKTRHRQGRLWFTDVVISGFQQYACKKRLILLDQSIPMGVDLLWESQLEYYICHNDSVEIGRLLNMTPSYSLSCGNLQISLDGLHYTSNGCESEFNDFGKHMYSIEELDAVCMDVLDIRILRLSAINMCSMWLKVLVEKQLAKQFIFLKNYWEGTEEIVCLLVRSGFMNSISDASFLKPLTDNSVDLDLLDTSGYINLEAFQGFNKLFVHHCAQNNLPNLLDLYLDNQPLALDCSSLPSLQGAAGDSQWAKWLLLSRVKGNEYDASFSNARSIASHNLVPCNSLAVMEIDDIIQMVDDIAEGAGEMAAVATLMFAPIPIQDCLSTGSVNRHRSSSAQCTLENLRPAIQHFPTLWRMLVAACFGQDPTSNFFSPRAKVFGDSDLSDYLNWRDNIFYSSGHDTSLLQMLPGCFSKPVKRLIQLYVQGPLGRQSVPWLRVGESFPLRDIDYVVNGYEHAEISTLSWEAAIQKHVEEELYGPSVEGSGLGLEHHLHRGRALAAFNHLLSIRVAKLKLEIGMRRGNSDTSTLVQSNVQSDVHTLLSPMTQSENSLLSSVIPLAIMHFEDSVLVASCAFLLELCGLSPNVLRVDIAALRRISFFFKSSDRTVNYGQLSPKGAAFLPLPIEGDITDSLARALAEYYLKLDNSSIMKGKETSNTNMQPTRALMLVLQYLEKASLPSLADGATSGSWLMSGNGDGMQLRLQQKAASQHWNLVTTFCKMHQIPLSTKYLVALARDNDWVGFLLEAQVGGYPFETVIQIASKEFSDLRLKFHISTVLRGMQSRRSMTSSSNAVAIDKRNATSFLGESNYIPVELFGIIADCEKKKNAGEALLLKAKDLCWSVLAMVASCFTDVSPLSCLTVWLEITAAREISSIKVNDIASQISTNVGAAVEAINMLPVTGRTLSHHYNRRNPKRRRLVDTTSMDTLSSAASDLSTTSAGSSIFAANGNVVEAQSKDTADENVKISTDSEEVFLSLSKMVAVLCKQHLFLPLLRAFEMFLPSCSLLPFIRALQAFSLMRLSEAAAHLGSFSVRIKEEPINMQANYGREGHLGTSWISSIAVKASDAMLSTCPSPYERRCLLQLLAATDFGDGGSAMTYYRQLYWKINLAEPSLRKDDGLQLGNESLDDASLLTALETNGHWEQARKWAKQLEGSGGPWKAAAHHVTEMQAESMVGEWKEFLWDVPEERVALWGHCQTLFLRYSYPPLQAGLFFLKHAEAVEKDLPSRELHELLLLSLQWLSGMITQSNPVYPLHLLREIETRVWLLAVESEAQGKSEGELTINNFTREQGTGKGSSIIDHTASIVTKMDNHINSMRTRIEKNDARDFHTTYQKNPQVTDTSFSTAVVASSKSKRRAKAILPSRRPLVDTVEKVVDSEDGFLQTNLKTDSHVAGGNSQMDSSFSKWEESIEPAELERAVLSLLEFGQITAARQLQHKLSPAHSPSEFILVNAALKLASASTPNSKVYVSMLDDEVRSVIQIYNLPADHQFVEPIQILESMASFFLEGRGQGLCKRLLSVVKAANVLGLSFSEAFDKHPIELLQLLSLKAQDSFEEAYLLVHTHSMAAASIAHILAESFLKGLLAAHRGGYIDSQKEEGPAPLLWRFSDFLKWAELCPSEPEVGHALMRLVITGQEIPHACEVELLILSHHFYKSSSCLDGVDVLVALAATRVDAYVSEGEFPCLARLITGVGNFHALNFILGILIENGQLDLLLQKYSAAADTQTGTAEAVRGFRMAVLTSLKQFNPNDLDGFAMVYNHFDMKHETASLLELRAEQSSQLWFYHHYRDQTEGLLDSMRYFIEAAEVHSSIDAGNKTRAACAQASLVSLQIRMPDFQWLRLSATNARRALVEQSHFQEALIVAEAYGLNQPGEWALVLWNQMLKPELTEQFVAEFVAVLPLHPTMLAEIARFYRAEVAARGDQSQFSVWLTGGGLPAEWAKYLGRSFRCLLRRTRDLRLRMQLATLATGFTDVINGCSKALDRVPENAGPLVLRKGHGGAYLPLM